MTTTTPTSRPTILFQQGTGPIYLRGVSAAQWRAAMRPHTRRGPTPT